MKMFKNVHKSSKSHVHVVKTEYRIQIVPTLPGFYLKGLTKSRLIKLKLLETEKIDGNHESGKRVSGGPHSSVKKV